MTRQLRPGDLKKVLLISVNMPQQYSLAMPLLKGYAETDPDLRRSVQIRVVNIELAGGGAETVRRCLDEALLWRPELLGLSCYVWNALVLRELCRQVRSKLPELLVILGGQEICEPMAEVGVEYPDADFLVEGEGEGPFRALLKALLEKGTDGVKGVAGIHYRDENGMLNHTGVAERIVALEDIPSPYLTGNCVPPVDSYFGPMIEITRGCPNRCAFCFESNRYRQPKSFPLERVEQELILLKRLGYKRFHFLDPILYHGGRLAAVHEIVSRVGLLDRDFFVELYADYIRREDIPNLGFVKTCDLGLQTISDDACRIIRRPFHRDRFIEGYRLLKEAGKSINLQLILGLPGDTLQGFLGGVKFAMGLQPALLMVNILHVLRGTPLRSEAPVHGLKYDPLPPYRVQECTTFPAADIQEAIAVRRRINATFFPDIRD